MFSILNGFRFRIGFRMIKELLVQLNLISIFAFRFWMGFERSLSVMNMFLILGQRWRKIN